jgi:magnesium chelatase subunit I
MSEQPSPPSAHSEPGEPAPVGSLRELIDIVTGRAFKYQVETEDAGLAEVIPFPFLALVGQEEMKLALIISVINPLVNGVLLVGPVTTVACPKISKPAGWTPSARIARGNTAWDSH